MCNIHEQIREVWLQDYRIDCTTGTYNWYRNFAYFGIVLWPVGFPLFCLGMLYYYKVPKIARRKQEKAEWAAFITHCMSMLADRGLPVLGLTLDQTRWMVGGLTEAQMQQMLLLFPRNAEDTEDSNNLHSSEESDQPEGTGNDEEGPQNTKEEVHHVVLRY